MPRDRRSDFRRAIVLPVLILCLPAAAGAQGEPPPQGLPTILVTPGLRQTFVLTDNVDLEPEGEEDSEFVSLSSAEVAFSFRPGGRRISLLGDAVFALTYDTGEEQVDLNALGLITGTAQVYDDNVFIDFAGSATRELTDSSGRVSGTGRDNDDQADVYAGLISPYVVGTFADLVEAQLRYAHTQVLVDDAGDEEDEGDSSVDYFGFLTSTGTSLTRLQVNTLAEAEYTRSDDDGGDLDRESLALGGIYTLTRQTALLGTIGYDWVDSDDFTEDRDGLRWSLGFGWTPGPRSSFELTYGERFQEPSIGFLGTYQLTPSIVVTGSIFDGLETEAGSLVGSSLGGMLDAATGTIVEPGTGLPIGLPGFSRPGGVDDVAILRRYRGTIAGFRGRNTYAVNLVREERDFDLDPDETVHVVFAGYGRVLRPNLAFRATGSWRETDVDGAGADTTGYVAGLGLDYQFAPRVTMTGAYSYSQQESDDPTDEFVENALIFSIFVTF